MKAKTGVNLDQLLDEIARSGGAKDKAIEMAVATGPIDRKKAEKIISKAYKVIGLEKPKFIWAEGPTEGCRIAAEIAFDGDVTDLEVRQMIHYACFGSFEQNTSLYYSFFADKFPDLKNESMDLVCDIVKHCGLFWCFDDVVVMVEKHTEIHLDKNNKLHNPTGPAISWPDGTKIYALSGEFIYDETELLLKGIMADE